MIDYNIFSERQPDEIPVEDLSRVFKCIKYFSYLNNKRKWDLSLPPYAFYSVQTNEKGDPTTSSYPLFNLVSISTDEITDLILKYFPSYYMVDIGNNSELQSFTNYIDLVLQELVKKGRIVCKTTKTEGSTVNSYKLKEEYFSEIFDRNQAEFSSN